MSESKKGFTAEIWIKLSNLKYGTEGYGISSRYSTAFIPSNDPKCQLATKYDNEIEVEFEDRRDSRFPSIFVPATPAKHWYSFGGNIIMAHQDETNDSKARKCFLKLSGGKEFLNLHDRDEEPLEEQHKTKVPPLRDVLLRDPMYKHL